MPTIIKGQPTGEEVIAKLKSENRPVLLAFSCGKDSLGAWCALREAGIEVIPAYLWALPNFKFIDEEIKHFEHLFGTKIYRYPHPSFWRIINSGMMQTPARLRAIYQAQIIEPTYEDTWAAIKDDLGLPQDTWVADGVRAADSIVRRASFVTHGVMKKKNRKVSPIADMLKAELMELLKRNGVDLPIDYQIWGRSFDGFDNRFVAPLKEHLPEDYEYAKEWFPLIETEVMRGRYLVKENRKQAKRDKSDSDYVMRAKQEAKRRDQATDGRTVCTICFKTEKELNKFCNLAATDDLIIPQEVVEQAFEEKRARNAQKAPEPRFGRVPASPLDDLEVTGSLETDCFSEAETLLEMLKAADEKPSGNAFTDTPYYRSIVFGSYQELETFLKARGMFRYGCMYLDGSRWLSTL